MNPEEEVEIDAFMHEFASTVGKQFEVWMEQLMKATEIDMLYRRPE